MRPAVVETSTRENLLYLAVDLGPEPELEEFVSQVKILVDIHHFCYEVELAKRGIPLMQRSGSVEPIDFPSLALVRTKLASPWVSVLGDAVNEYVPIAYGAAALLGLHRIMKMIMEWQSHRENIEDRRSSREEALSVRESVSLLLEYADKADLRGETLSNLFTFVGAVDAVRLMGNVRDSEIIDRDDPRVSEGFGH